MLVSAPGALFLPPALNRHVESYAKDRKKEIGNLVRKPFHYLASHALLYFLLKFKHVSYIVYLILFVFNRKLALWIHPKLAALTLTKKLTT